MGRSTTQISPVIYIGIDYHKSFCVVCLGDAKGNVIAQEKVSNEEGSVRKFFSQYKGASCAIESSRAFEWFVDLLRELGLTVVVCHPRRVKLIAQTAFKTDKRDSKILMMLLARDFIPTCYFPTQEERALRERLRWRVHLVRQTTRMKLKIHAMLDKEHKGWSKKDLFSKAGRKYIEDVQLTPARRELLDKTLAALEFFECQLGVEEKWIVIEAKRRTTAQLLMTMPGIGALSAMVLIAELGDVSRFRKAEQIGTYFGLVPRESSSADVRKLGRITKEGSTLVRWLLIQDAWTAVQHDPYMRRKFLQVSKRRGKNVAIVGIARKLSEIAFCIIRDQKPYDVARLENVATTES